MKWFVLSNVGIVGTMYAQPSGKKILKQMIGATLTNQLNVNNAGIVLLSEGKANELSIYVTNY
jgi:hypothetical protein